MSELNGDGIWGFAFYLHSESTLLLVNHLFPSNNEEENSPKDPTRTVSTCSSLSDCDWSEVAAKGNNFLSRRSRSGKATVSQFSLPPLSWAVFNGFGAWRRAFFFSLCPPLHAVYAKYWETRVCAKLKVMKFCNNTRLYSDLSRSRFLSACGSVESLLAVFDGDKLLRTTSEQQLEFSKRAVHRNERKFSFLSQILEFLFPESQ